MMQWLARARYKMIPRRLFSRLAGVLYGTQLSRLLIPLFISRYGVRMEEYVRTVKQYHSLVDFFCREIKSECRVITPGADFLVSPVDGRIAEYGDLVNGTMVQAKGVYYSPSRLLGDADAAARYDGGKYITIYLSPADYHRIHAPIAGVLHRATHIPGTRWPVNEKGVSSVPQLFEKNERLITWLDTVNFSRVAVVKVGAYIVGRIRAVYDTSLGDPRSKKMVTMDYAQSRQFDKGEEMARFEFGSTVILLVEKGPYRFAKGVENGKFVKLGESILERDGLL